MQTIEELEKDIEYQKNRIKELKEDKAFIEENMDEDCLVENDDSDDDDSEYEEDYYGTMEEVNDIDFEIGEIEEQLEIDIKELEKLKKGLL